VARRGENIYLRKDGRWEGRYIKGYRPDRKPIYGSVYGRKYNECKEKLIYAKSQYMKRCESLKTYGEGNVSGFMNYWLYDIIRQGIKASTFSNYSAILDKWIKPFLGNIKLCKLDRENIQRFINTLSEHGLSAGTVGNIYRVLYAAMKKARDYNYVYINPCEGISLPKTQKKEARLLTFQEQKKLEHAAKTDKNGFAVLLAMYTGLRVGEICGLKWSDVDLKNEVIHVSRTIQRIKSCSLEAATKTVLISDSTKSNHSARAIPLPIAITKLFKEHKKRAFSEYVFNYHGHHLEPRRLQYRFKALLKKAGLADINFHALRHTFATRCMELCFDVKTLSEILGHASAKMTLDRYGHSQIEHKRAAMASLDRLFERLG